MYCVLCAVHFYWLRVGLCPTILGRVDSCWDAEGASSFAVEGFDFDLILGERGDGGVLVHVVPGLRVRHRHLQPLRVVNRPECHNVAKVPAIVVLWLHRLRTQTTANNKLPQMSLQT